MGPILGCLVAVILYEVFLSEDACWLRTKAWLTDHHYYRHHSYFFSGRPVRTTAPGEPLTHRFHKPSLSDKNDVVEFVALHGSYLPNSLQNFFKFTTHVRVVNGKLKCTEYFIWCDISSLESCFFHWPFLDTIAFQTYILARLSLMPLWLPRRWQPHWCQVERSHSKNIPNLIWYFKIENRKNVAYFIWNQSIGANLPSCQLEAAADDKPYQLCPSTGYFQKAVLFRWMTR